MEWCYIITTDNKVDELLRFEPTFNASLCNKQGKFLRIDHTFWACKFARNSQNKSDYTSLFTIMNEYQEILAYFFCDSKSLNELKTEFLLFKKRMIENVSVIWTDNPRSDANFLREIFGEDLIIKKDIFHVLQDYYKMCFK